MDLLLCESKLGRFISVCKTLSRIYGRRIVQGARAY